MIETCFIIMIIFACIIGVILIIKWCNVLIDNHGTDTKASEDLERCMDTNNVNGVRSLLEVRGHLLKPEVRNNAKVWLAEKS